MLFKFKSLVKSEGFIRYFKNTGWMMFEQLLRIVSSLFVGIWVARYLGPEQFGLFSYILAFTAIFGAIAKIGLDGIVVRDLVNHPHLRDSYLGTAFWLKIIGALAVLIILAAIMPFTSNDDATNFYIFIIAIGLLFQSFEVVEFYFQSQVLAKFISICKIIQVSISSLIKIFLVLGDADLVWFVFVTSFDFFTLSVVYAIAYRKKVGSFFYFKFEPVLAKQLFSDSWPLIFSAILVMIYTRIDQIMIKSMLGEYEVGIYSAAVRISEALYFIPMLITASVFPAILNAKRHSLELYKKRLQELYTLIIWLSVLVIVPITFLSDWIILMLFGEAYKSAGSVLMIHAWGLLFVSVAVVKGRWQMAENLTRHHMYGAAISSISNVVLNYYMIPKWGISGAAISTLLSQFISAYLINYLFVELKNQNSYIHRAIRFF